MKVLITGGAGFIGHNLAVYLSKRGFDVTALDNMERASGAATAKLIESGVKVITADVRDFDNYDGFDVVVHAAAYVSVEESVADPLKYIHNNAYGTSKVAYECAKRGIKMIYLSSAAVYGEPKRLPIDEEHPREPISPYGLSKLMGELVLSNFRKAYGLGFVTLRLFNVYGPGQNPNYAGVITNFIERAMRGEPLVIYGDGEQTRDFIFVEDVARVIEAFIEEGAFDGEAYNVGTGVPTKIIELAHIIRSLVGRDVGLVFMPSRPGDIRHSFADVSKLRERFPISFTPLREGLAKLIKSQ